LNEKYRATSYKNIKDYSATSYENIKKTKIPFFKNNNIFRRFWQSLIASYRIKTVILSSVNGAQTVVLRKRHWNSTTERDQNNSVSFPNFRQLLASDYGFEDKSSFKRNNK
jgi:hypothetical protein